jgi:hypothetical protein
VAGGGVTHVTRWACEAPQHEGERFDVHRHDRFTRRQTFMRIDGAERLHERSADRICRRCIRLEVEGERDQGALL